MSKEEFTGGALSCRQKFKGVENFLKRVAFNLGNTPSQTEVKIISCIPIDVTDLQQKIIHLEKQLEEAATTQSKACAPVPGCKSGTKTLRLPGPKRTSVNTALLASAFPCYSTAEICCKSFDVDRSTSPPCSHTKKKSNVSFIVPANCKCKDVGHVTTSNSQNSCTPQGTGDKTNNIEHRINNFSPKMCEPKQNENRRNFFRKKKKLIKNKRCKSPCVYYVQTNSSPFYKSDLTEEVPKQECDLMSRSYLARMINKQYKPKLLGDNLSRISQFSKPICRDDQPNCMGTCRYESDVCSCCHGPFQNIDNDVGTFNNTMTYMVNEMNTGSAYYDTNQYDLVPVKEKPVKIKKELDIPRKKEPKPHIDMKCWPENVRTKYRYYSYPPPTNYHVRPRTDYVFREKLDNYGRKMPTKLNRIEPIVKKVAKRRKEIYKRDRPIHIETSKSCSIDFGTVYPRKAVKKPKKHESLQPIPVPLKNAECLTTVINNSECQTVISNAEANTSDAKTEATLNQIKMILQSVLAEVKDSSQPRTQSLEEKPKKDAFVQKGPSQSNMQTSSLMNSITYSPYAMSQIPFMPSCSSQLNPNQLCYPNSTMKCFQNFPLFIQNQGRHVCASCFRNSSNAKPAYMKQATTIATNTEDVKEERTKETEKLIKEIYKSMALTMDMPNKDTSSEYDDTMKSVRGFTTPLIIKTEPKKQAKKIRNVVQAVSELFMKKDIVETSDTLNTTIESKLPSTINDVSMRSQVVTTDTELRGRNERLEKYLRPRSKQSETTETEKRTYDKTTTHATTTIITESETSSSDGESETTLVHTEEAQEAKQKKEKQGLFSKMFKNVKLFKLKEKDKIKKKDEKTESEEDTFSDSDDYQTVYSQKIHKTPNRVHRNRAHNLPRRKTHSKISYKQTYQRDKSPEKKRSPYMEQEYRRYWDERLMFHDKPKHSSERFYSDQTTPQKSAYYQTYEARSAFVEPKNVPRTERRINRDDGDETQGELKATSKGMAWLKKHKMGIHCGEQWKKLLEG